MAADTVGVTGGHGPQVQILQPTQNRQVSGFSTVPRGIEPVGAANDGGLRLPTVAQPLNAAVSRGQWATFLVHSSALADHLPATPAGLQQLGAYLALSDVMASCLFRAQLE